MGKLTADMKRVVSEQPPGTDGYRDGVARLSEAGSTVADRAKAIVVVEVLEARPITSPAYDDGSTTEAELIRTFQHRFARMHPPEN